MGLCLIGPSIHPRCYFALAVGAGGLSLSPAAFCAERRTMSTQLDWRLDKLERTLRAINADLDATNRTLEDIIAMVTPRAPKPRPKLSVLPGEKKGGTNA